MKPLRWLVYILLSVSMAQAQTISTSGPHSDLTRKRTLHHSNVLRKKAKSQPNRYHVKKSTRDSASPRHSLNSNASRTQPMITKPFVPVPLQP